MYMMAALSYQLPSHHDSYTEDRFSVCEQYSDQPQVPHWLFIETLLLKPMEQLEDLLDIISNCQYDLEFPTLKSVFPTDNPKKIISSIIKAALRMPELFPTGFLEIHIISMKRKLISLTREQIACLLAHMFLCTLKTPSWNKHWCTFGIWYASTSQPAEAYLKCLLAYFSELDLHGKPPNPLEEVKFIRCVLQTHPSWNTSTSYFTDDILSLSHNVYPEPGCNVEVSFANKDVGYGVSGTQEEVKMGMSPEACVVMLISPTLQDNEVLLIQGVRQIGLHEGIGRHLKFVGVQTKESRDWNLRSIIAMDAMEIDSLDEDSVIELKEPVLLRELNKAYCGFISVGKERVLIATGHWGCGAFGGNKFVKSLIQLMAACEANKCLVFHELRLISNHSYFLETLAKVVAKLSQKRLTVGELFIALTKLDARSSDVFGSIVGEL